MNQNREHQSPTAEAQSSTTDSQNGQSTTTHPEVEDLPLLNHHLHHQEEDPQFQHLHQHLPQPQYVESESNFGSDSSTDVEDKYPTPNPHAGKNEIFIKVKRIRITTKITIVKLIAIKKIFRRKDGIHRAPKITVDTTHIAGPHTRREEDVIEETESGWITDEEAEDEGDKAAPSGDNTTTAAGSSPSSVDNAGN